MGKTKARICDVIVIFGGCDVPVVLRDVQLDNSVRSKLVGEFYLDGWMDGRHSSREVVDDVDQDLADAQPNTDHS
jgi:hypothetical protein